MFQEIGRRQNQKAETRLEVCLQQSLDDLAVGKSLVVGVSGGADSMALLDALCRWKQRSENGVRIVVAHLNHLLRDSASDGDEDFVREAATRLGLPFEFERCDVAAIAKSRQENLESVARECRYDFLHRVALASLSEKGDEFGAVVLTAHHADDQAETFLMRLLRGSGTTGLTGIRPQRQLSGSVRLIRPLLGVDRATVLEHCRHYGIDFRIDQSNFEVDYFRNRIRHELLVDLRRYNGSVSEIIVRTVELLRDDEVCLQDLAREQRQRVTMGDGLAIDLLLKLPVALRRRVVRDWIAERRGGMAGMTSSHSAAIERLLERSQSGRRIELPGGLVVQRVFETLRFVDELQVVPSPQALTPGRPVDFGSFWILLQADGDIDSPPVEDGRSEARWKIRLRAELPRETWSVRGRTPGDQLRPNQSRHRIKLKKLMIRHKIPVSKRDTWPVIVTGDQQLVWVPGLAFNADAVSVHSEDDGDRKGFWLLAGEK